jgi:CDP-diacylglycerol--serine O-phosphatidyltransferase
MNAAKPARRPRPNLRKLMFVLPNLFTVSSIFCGVYSILLSSGERSGSNFYYAAVAIFFGTFFDAFDGRVARLTKTQSEFGVELDSLADVITFGVAPAILVYKWALSGMGTLGIFICGAYASCGAIRLARFNVLTHAEHESSPTGVSRFFVGLPIPLAAGMIVSLVLALRSPDAGGPVPIAVLMCGLSFLMVSTVRYRTFKDAQLGPGSLLAFGAVLAVFLFFAFTGRVQQVFLVYFSFYILLGLAEEALFGRRRRARQRQAAEAQQACEGQQGADADEELLPAEEDEEDGDEDGEAARSEDEQGAGAAATAPGPTVAGKKP